MIIERHAQIWMVSDLNKRQMIAKQFRVLGYAIYVGGHVKVLTDVWKPQDDMNKYQKSYHI